MINAKEKRAFLTEKSASPELKINRLKQQNYNTSQKQRETKAAKLKRHQIYDRLLSYLENNQIHSAATEKKLDFILHENAKKALQNLHNFSKGEIINLEVSVLRDAERMNGFEVSRDFPTDLFYQYERLGNVEFIIDNRIVPVPGLAKNISICRKLEGEFTRPDLLSVDGFIEDSTRDKSGTVRRFIRQDFDEYLVRRGFAVPVINDGLIDRLKIFRRPDDEKPFLLRSRVGGLRW